jgi:sec-independent protein translocase protein TatB
MFDFGFSEVLLTSVIALIVLGPEKLPKAASQVGRWVGRARAMARQFREQLEEEVNLETVKKAHKEEEARREAEARRTAAEGSAGTSGAPDGQASSSPGTPDSGSRAHETSASAADVDPYTQTAASPNTAVGDPISPELAKIRADTYSHAHPTDEFGANPLTANGAAEPEAAFGHVTTDAPDSSAPESASTPAAAPPRPETGEAYASASPPASDTPAPPTAAHSPTAPEKSGPA